MIIFFLFTIGLIIVTTQIGKSRFFVVLLVGYVVNLALIFTQRYVRPVFYSSDQQRFLDLANELVAMDFFAYIMQFDPTGSYLISWFAALVFKLLGSDLLYVNFFFVYAWLGTVIVLHNLALSITGSRNVAFLISFLLIFTPSISIVNAAFLRESFLIFFLSSSVYYSYSWFLSKRFSCFIKSVILMTLAGFFHGAFYFLSIFLLLFYMKENLLRPRIRYYDLFIILALLPFIAVTSIKLSENVKIQMAFSLLAGEERAVERYLSSSEGISDQEGINRLQLPAIDTSGTTSFATSLAKRVAVFASSPFFHHYNKITDIPRIYDSLIFIFMCFILIVAYIKGRRYNDERIRFYFKFFVPMILLLVIMFSLGSFDVGTSQRHRLKFLPVFMVVSLSIYFMILAISKKSKRNNLLSSNGCH